jgi:hypothetical protein
MKYAGKALLIFIALGFSNPRAISQTFYSINSLQKIEVYFSQANWDYMMDTSKAGAEGYVMADSIKINGSRFDSVGIKYKGNSSYNASKIKNPFHINLKKFNSVNPDYQGYTEIKLSNCYQDPSMIREPLAYSILSNYMHCPKSGFAQVYINGAYVGLYSNDEDISKPFLKEHFFDYSANENAFFKCSHSYPSTLTKCNLKYINSDSSQYFSLYEMKSNVGWNELVNLCDTVTNYPSYLSSVIDVDRVIWMLAFNNVLVNLDSYSGYFVQNYYLVKDNSRRFNPIVWDLNMAFGGFPFTGNQAGGTGSLTVTAMEQLSLALHGNDADWPLIKDILNNPMYKRMYVAHMKTIVNEMFLSGYYLTLAQQMQAVVDTAVQSDVNKEFSYTQFQNGLTGNVVSGSYTIPGISGLMSGRVTYLQATPEFLATAPAITNVADVITNNTAAITANVTSANPGSVYLGYRFDTTGAFTRILMYDDGLHNDGSANDNVFGVSLAMSTNKGQYYVYAENNDAGMFSPQRAEHEFYHLINAAGVEQIVAGNEIKLFPNPANNNFTVELKNQPLKNTRLIIRNYLGQVVAEEKVAGKLTELNSAGFSPGIYFIQYGSYSRKLLIVH